MFTINIHDAKIHLSRLADRAALGNASVIANAGEPMVKVVPLEGGEAGVGRRIGFMAGGIEVPDDFDQMGSDVIAKSFGIGI